MLRALCSRRDGGRPAAGVRILPGLVERAQLRVPVGLELVGDQAVVGVDLHVASAREIGFVARALDLLLAQAIGLVGARLELLLHGQAPASSAMGVTVSTSSSPIASSIARRGSSGRAARHARSLPLADVDRERLPPCAVVIAHRHALAAEAADHQALQQRRPFARRASRARRRAPGQLSRRRCWFSSYSSQEM